MPEYLVLDEDGRVVRIAASNHSEAAEAAREIDPDDFEAPDEVNLAVREVDGGPWLHRVVYRNLSPTYTATRCPTPYDWQEPTPEEIAEALGEAPG